MEPNDNRRAELRERLNEVLGAGLGGTLMESLPPSRWDDLATKVDVTSVKDEVTSVKADVAVLKTDVAVLKTDVAVLKTDVAVLKTDVAVLKTDVAVLKTDVAALDTRLTAFVVEVDHRFNRVDMRFDALDVRLDDRFARAKAETEALIADKVGLALAQQTRTLIMAQASSLFATVAIVFTVVRLAT